VTAETLLSGPGLLRLYRACSRLNGDAAVCTTSEAVTLAGLAGSDRPAAEALRLFARSLGRFAGDLTLIFAATGGVFIGSGIAPTITSFLDTADFRASFEDKAPFRASLNRIPTFVIMHPEPAMVGLSALACDPHRFIFEQQTWAR
jgi:glucokinase